MMLIYGANTMSYFEEIDTTIPIANQTITVDDPVVGDLPGENTVFAGATLSLKSETTLSLYFTSNSTLSFHCDGKTVVTAKNGNYQVARIRDIAINDLGEKFTLTVTAGENSGAVTYSPLNYCKDMIANEDASESLQNALKALYLYYVEAVKYFANRA